MDRHRQAPAIEHASNRARLVRRPRGNAVSLLFDGMCHIWQLYAPMLDEGMQSIEEAAAFIRAHQA